MQTNTLLSSTKDSVKIIKTIFYWQSKEGRSCHCLLRIYKDILGWLNLEPVEQVLTELASH
ncbi:hypothetical protein [Floridanema evergladense]|uniref:Uncharacterized protein n=1 Tax=Floridaenema evergladense BLCC-F167 TaxID=3153639 RepID=A0ABV4WK78_9CYAN